MSASVRCTAAARVVSGQQQNSNTPPRIAIWNRKAGRQIISRVLQVVGQFAKIDRWLVDRGVLEKLKPSETDLHLQGKPDTNTDKEVQPNPLLHCSLGPRDSAAVLLLGAVLEAPDSPARVLGPFNH